MKKILFLSQIYPKRILPILEKNSKVILDYAGHNLSSAIFSGFIKNGYKIDVINTPHVGSFPPYFRSLYVPSYKDNIIDSIGFFNVSFIKRASIYNQLRRRVLNWCKTNSDDNVILVYNFEPLRLISSIKKRYPQTKIVLLVTDLIEYQSTGMTTLKRINMFVEKIFRGNTDSYNFLDIVDAFVLLAPQMAENLKVGNRPWIQVEGIYNNDNKIPDTPKTHKKTLLYSGNLGKRYGICELLAAFSQIHDNEYELQICGGGDGLDEIKKYEALDPRIKYLGILPRSEVQKLQKAATVLVNPRNSNDVYTIYSFPSKTMEYLASGTPVIMSHLKSIPPEYDSHIFYVEDESIEGWRNKIIDVCSKDIDDLNRFGEAAKNFIMTNKTPILQVKRIIELIEKL